MDIKLKTIDNVNFITLENSCGMEVVLCTIGASFYELKLPDKNNVKESIILTPSNLSDFYPSYYGKCIGRFSGRIDKGRCEINGKTYELDINWGGVSSLHGGFDGLSSQNFAYDIEVSDKYTDVIFTYLEKEKILPGDVEYRFVYRVMEDSNDINLTFNATTTKDTVVNLTNHVYFNLSGDGKRDVTEQKLQFLCDKYTRLNNELITESIDPVNEVMDFREIHEIGDFINDESLQNHTAKGYDHCWIKEDLNNPVIAVMKDDESGRKLTVSTSYPAIVCYSCCYPDSYPFNEKKFNIHKFYSICVECQYVPNGINMDGVDKAILREGEEYNHYIHYHFDVEE